MTDVHRSVRAAFKPTFHAPLELELLIDASALLRLDTDMAELLVPVDVLAADALWRQVQSLAPSASLEKGDGGRDGCPFDVSIASDDAATLAIHGWSPQPDTSPAQLALALALLDFALAQPAPAPIVAAIRNVRAYF